MYDDFDFDDSHDVSVMLQQAVSCLGWRDLLKGTSPQAHLMSTNPGGGSLISNTNTDTNNKLSQLESDGSSFGSMWPGLKSDIGYTVSHQIDCHMYGEGIPLCRVDFTQYQFYTGTNYVYLVFIFNQKHGDHVWAFLEQARDTQRFTIYTCTSVPSGTIQIILEAVTTNSENQPNTVDIGEANCLPLNIQGNFALAIDDNLGISPSSDYSIPNKKRVSYSKIQATSNL